MKKLVFSALAMVGLAFGANAQTATHGVDVTINSVVQIRATNAGATAAPANTGIVVGNATTPGDAPSVTLTNASALYLQYTSVKASSGTPRTIKAQITTGAVPAGFGITATATTPSSTGVTGDTGATNGTQTITDASAVTVITNIGSGYTGIAAGNGSNVTYAAAIGTVASLQAASLTTLTVTYTLSNE